MIYTHSHIDHFGGVKGVTTQADVDAGRVAVPTRADAAITLSMAALLGLAMGQTPLDDLASAGVEVSGDSTVIARLFSTLQAPDPDFPIVTPADRG